MKGQTISGGKFLTLPFLLVLILLSTACFTIVADDARPPDQNNNLASPASGVTATTLVSDTESPNRDNDNAYELELIADPRPAADFVVNPKPNSRGAYQAGTSVTIDVLRNPGWEIEQWVGPVYAISGDIAKVNMDQDQTVVVRMSQAGAVPVPPITPRPAPTSTLQPTPTHTPQPVLTFTLTVNGMPVSNPFIELDNGNIEVRPRPSGPHNLYLEGTQVRLTAVPASGHQLAGWRGACASDGNVCLLTMNANKNVGAAFEPRTGLFTLSIDSVPADGGEVRVSPAANASPNLYMAGTSVTLQAVAAPGFVFKKWEGTCAGSGEVCSLVMNGNQQVSAVFAVRNNTYSLRLGVVPEDGGRIKADPRPNSPDGKYIAGTRVVLKAVAADNFHFRGWDGACSGNNETCNVVMNGNQQVVAAFVQERETYSLQVSVNPENYGRVGVTPGPNADNGRYNPGTRVILFANPVTGYEFAGWEGACTGDNQVCGLTMNSDKKVEAHFAVKTYALAVGVAPPEGGGVIVTPGFDLIFDTLHERFPNISDAMVDRLRQLVLEHRYPHGLEVRLEAAAGDGFVFSRWGGSCSNLSGNVCELVMTSDQQATAFFVKESYTLAVNDILVSGGSVALDNGSVEITPAPNVAESRFSAGTQVTLTATPDAGFALGAWGGACADTQGNACSLTMTGNQEVEVEFAAVTAATDPVQ